jgi:hypothetical protein
LIRRRYLLNARGFGWKPYPNLLRLFERIQEEGP